MASNSTHRGDVFLWVIKVIESSTAPKHLNAARKLMNLFEQRFRKEMDWNEWIEVQATMETLIYKKTLELVS